MKITNSKIINDAAGLAKMAEKELPVKASYAIAKNISKLESELKVYNKERERLLEKYSEKDEQGKTIIGENNQVAIQREHFTDWDKDLKDLLEIENEVNIYTFPISVLDGCNLTPAELILIEYMITE